MKTISNRQYLQYLTLKEQYLIQLKKSILKKSKKMSLLESIRELRADLEKYHG